MNSEATTLYTVWTDALPWHSFMLQDVLGSLVAVLAFAAVLYAPGYVLAWPADLFGFRQMRFAERSLWAIACSFIATPIAAYLIGKIAGLNGTVALAAVCAIATALLLWRDRSQLHWTVRERRITATIVCGWTLFVLLMLVEFQMHGKLYFSVVMADQSYRIAFTDAVVRTGVPPANPLYFAGSAAPMRYFYFWYVLCATVVKLAHVSARHAFIASSIWAGFGLIATVRLYATHFFRWERRTRWIALGLLLVTGADLVPALGNAILQPTLNGDIEWWSVDPIDAWPDSLLWVPHHVASVLCCLLAFLLLWKTRENLSVRTRRWTVGLAAVAAASAFGLSVYVAFGFALLMLAWLIRLALLHLPQRIPLLRRTLAAAVLSAVLLVPFLQELLTGSKSTNPADTISQPQHLFSLSVRRMIDSGLLSGLPVFATANHAHPVLLDQTIRLVLLLPGLAMELGLFGAVLVLLLLARRHRALSREPARDTALFFTVCGLLLTLFLSSSVISNNDFGYRAVMLPQFFLMLLTADLLGSWTTPQAEPLVPITPGRRRLLYSLLALGIAGTAYGAFLLRAWLPIEASRPRDGFAQLPEDAYQVREAFATMNRVAPTSAVVSFRSVDLTLDRPEDEVMTPNDFFQRILVMDTGRQMLNAEWKCAVHFGGDPSSCPEIKNATSKLFASPLPGAEWTRGYCKRFGVQYLAIGHRDPNWTTSTGWPVTLPIVAEQPGFRIVDCR